MKKELSILTLTAAVLLCARESRADEASPEAAAQPAPAIASDTPAEKAEAAPAKKAAFTEPGRFGIVGAVTGDGFQAGIARLGQHYEAALTVDSGWSTVVGSGHSASGDIGLTLRGGPRFALSTYNFLSLGLQGHFNPVGNDDGVSKLGSFAAGGYVGVSRHFAGSPLVISLWVLPYQFDHEVMNDGTGKRMTADTHQFFQGGGFGLTYLF